MSGRYEVVVMGTSTGGLHALTRLLAALPARYSLPIVIVQHRSKDSDERLPALLQVASPLPLREAEDKEPLRSPGVYLGPPDYHLLVEPESLALSTEEPVAYSRPSIDVLFESASYAFGSAVIGVLLTAFGFDPWNLIPSIQRLIRKIWNLGWDAIDSVWRYFVLGAIIVFPIWLIARLVRSRHEPPR